ncbi:hypothetical protein GCM10023165_07310 [Variovorax defluvii]|uniref:Uncharacterized protein n=1 Tax=Variovorax defluvii TaxID=913761 RepID=A0ABP8H0H8_9BURK
MLRFTFVFAFVVAACALVALEKYRSEELQARRTAEQVELLQRLEALDRPSVARLVAEWRMTYPEPSADRIGELRDLVRQLQSDPTSIEAPPYSP